MTVNPGAYEVSPRLRSVILSRKGSIRHRAYDLITAATALEYGLTVVTSNTRDYQDIAGLTTYDPRTGSLVTH
jgi:predicted nucleic acid-binding protein